MKRAKHSLSFTKLLSCDMGELVPCGITEVLPGDSIQHSVSALIRCAPMLAPIMHPVEVRFHSWFVPHRLTWSSWENFITGGADGLNASVFPTITIGGGSGAAVGSLADYLGVPTGVNNIVVSALPFRAYALIFNEWYRDEDLVTALGVSLADGADATTNTVLQNCAWEKDYWTSGRPWEQKGASVSIPLTGTAPIKGIGFTGTPSGSPNNGQTVRESSPLPNRTMPFGHNSNDPGLLVEMDTSTHTSATKPMIYADLSNATAVTINALRQAAALQRYQENRARYGSRYPEYLAYLGVRSSDARLCRPEYLGGGRQTIQFSEVLQTGPGTDPVGDLKGHGIAAMRSNRYRRFFEEHGYVITLVSVRPKTIYMNGLLKHWNRRVKTDFWQKELEHIGQQAIARKEVYAAAASPDGVFGYQDRYDEYRRNESTVSGEFRSSTLNFWHLARDFGAEPSLNSSFVQCVPTKRNFAVTTEDCLYIHCKHSMQARRLVAPIGNSFLM